MKKALSLILALVLVLSCVPFALADGPIELEMWESFGGNVGPYLQKLAEEYNGLQSKYRVTVTYAGNYREALTKLQSTAKSEHPNIFMQDMEDAFQVYCDPGELYIPVQNFIDAEGPDYVMPSFLGCLKTSYSDANGRLLALPLGNSLAGLWYNADLLEKHGIDAQKDLGSYAGILAAARKLKEAGVKYPYYQGASSSFISMAMTAQGIQYMDMNNGKDGIPTKQLFGEVGSDCYNATVEFFSFLQTMAKEDLMVTFGATTDDVQALWLNGDNAFWCGFVSGYTARRDVVNGKFNFGWRTLGTVSDIPAVGSGATGSCLFVSSSCNEEEAAGAWDFLKFVSNPTNVVGFAKASGYLPTTMEGVESEEYQQFMAEDFTTAKYAIDLEVNTPAEYYNAWIPMFTDYHALCKEWYGYAINNPDEDPAEITIKFANAVQECIDLYRLQYGL